MIFTLFHTCNAQQFDQYRSVDATFELVQSYQRIRILIRDARYQATPYTGNGESFLIDHPKREFGFYELNKEHEKIVKISY